MYQINDTFNSLFNVVLNLFILSLLALHTLTAAVPFLHITALFWPHWVITSATCR